jgi:hypothetical protein
MLYLCGLTLLVLGGLLLAWDARGAIAQELETWTAATSLPLRMAGGMAHCPDTPDSFYITSGIEGDSISTDRLLRYDISPGTWTELARMPEPLRMVAVTCYEGKIYAAGGWNGTLKKTLYIYDIATDTWSSGRDLPDKIWAAGLGAWDGKLYLVGGTYGGFYTASDRVDVFDIASGKWTEAGGTAMPTASGFFAYAQAGSYLYVVGGFSTVEPVNVDQTQRYDMATDTWSVGPTFTSARALGSLSVSANHLYMLGGDLNLGGIGDITDLVEVLDLSGWPEGAWADLGDPLVTPDIYPSTTCTETLSGGEIWDVGGGDEFGISHAEVYYRSVGEPCTAAAYGVSVAPESDEKLGATGETIDFQLTVTNTGSMCDTFDITLSGNLWTTVAPLTTDLVDPGGDEEVTVSVTIPAEALPGEQDMVQVTFTSQGDPEVTATATLTTRNYWYGLSVTPESAEQTGLPGEILTYTITVTNTGEAGDMFDIAVDGNLWVTSAPASTIWLESAVSDEIQVTVTIPLDALPGAVDDAVLTFTSQHDPESTDTVILTSRVPYLFTYLPLMYRALP